VERLYQASCPESGVEAVRVSDERENLPERLVEKKFKRKTLKNILNNNPTKMKNTSVNAQKEPQYYY
jgi:hypothetical protein